MKSVQNTKSHLKSSCHIRRHCECSSFFCCVRRTDELPGGSCNSVILQVKRQVNSFVRHKKDFFRDIFVCFFRLVAVKSLNYFLLEYII